MFTIEIGALEPGVHSLKFEPGAASLELDPDRFKGVEVEARLDVTERRILVSLSARATATLECDRTLRKFDQVLEGSYHMLYGPPGFIDADEDAYDEVRELEPTDQEIDLTSVVRDTILLAIPARCIAPGAEEEDIPTKFGAPEEEESIDPRWAALRELKSGANQN